MITQYTLTIHDGGERPADWNDTDEVIYGETVDEFMDRLLDKIEGMIEEEFSALSAEWY